MLHFPLVLRQLLVVGHLGLDCFVSWTNYFCHHLGAVLGFFRVLEHN